MIRIKGRKLIYVLFALALVAPCNAGINRIFGGKTSQPMCPFYAEVIMQGKYKGHEPISSRALIWSQDLKHYRVELVNSPKDRVNCYLTRYGTHIYSTMADPNHPENAKWLCCPAFWMGKDTLETEIQQQWHIQNPVLVGIENLDGIRTEHWCNNGDIKLVSLNNTRDIWLSTDKRFPLVLKMESHSPKGSFRWEIRNLHLNQPMPSQIFTPQIRLKTGAKAMLMMQYKPLWMVIIWHILVLLAYSWLVFTITKGKLTHRNVLSVACASFAILSLFWLAPHTDQYQNQLSDLPVLILFCSMIAITLIYWIKKFPIPGGVRMLAGTRWHVAIWILIAAGVALWISNSNTQQTLASFNFRLIFRELPFLPQTLTTTLIYAAAFAALEEVVFRGYIMGLLMRRYSSTRRANMFQALIFAVEHIPKLLRTPHTGSIIVISGFCAIFVFGLVFGSLRLKYNNLGASWLVHTGYNTGFNYVTNAGIYSLLSVMASI